MENVKEINNNKEKDSLSLMLKHFILAKHIRHINHPILDILQEGQYLKENPFPYNFALVGTQESYLPVIINNDNEVHYTTFPALESLLHQHLDKIGMPFWNVSNKCHREIIQYWQKETSIINEDKIQAISNLSENNLCFKKLDFDILFESSEPTPMFDEIMERWENSIEFMKFVGMLMGPGYLDQQKYIWVAGEGGAGKGCVQRILHRVLGKSAVSMTGKMFNSRFGLSMCVGKRLVSFEDEMNDKFITDGNMMAHTGGGESIVEFKRKGAFSTRLKFLPMIYSNYEPEVTRGEHARRLIFVKAKAPKDKVQNMAYENQLWKEAPAWLGKCYAAFLNDPIFSSCDKMAEELTYENMDWAQDIIDDSFIIGGEKSKIKKSEIKSFLTASNKSKREIKDFLAFFEQYLDTKETTIWVGGKGAKGYKNVVLKKYFG